MKAMAISEFKAHALEVIGTVAENKERIIITKRGKPIAELSPYTQPTSKAGKLADAFVSENDIVSPLGADMWNATK